MLIEELDETWPIVIIGRNLRHVLVVEHDFRKDDARQPVLGHKA